MPEIMRESVTREESEQNAQLRTAVARTAAFTVGAVVVAALVVLVAMAVYGQDKYSLISPGGIAFSDFKGYEDWSLVSSARTDEVLKVIVANPTMIDAYKAGFPATDKFSRMAPAL